MATANKQKGYRDKSRRKHPNTQKKYYAGNKDRWLAYAWKARGIPFPTRPRPPLCECCGKPPRIRILVNDHDHKKKKFRGWLCFDCNLGIGKLGDDLAGIERAVRYMKNFGEVQ